MLSKVKINQKAWSSTDGGEGIPIPNSIYIDDQKIEGVLSVDISYKPNEIPLITINMIESFLEREIEGEVEIVTLNGKRYKLVS